MILTCPCGVMHNGTYGDVCEDCFVAGSRICQVSSPPQTPLGQYRAPAANNGPRPSRPQSQHAKERMFRLTNPRGL
jgi:hypothetical protein